MEYKKCAGARDAEDSFTAVIYDAGVALSCHSCDSVEELWWCAGCGCIECLSCDLHALLCSGMRPLFKYGSK